MRSMISRILFVFALVTALFASAAFAEIIGSAPTVSVSHSPLTPTNTENVTFSATANDSDGVVTEIKIFVDNSNVKTCSNVLGVNSCVYTGGPYSIGTHTYSASAKDNLNNVNSTSNKTFTVVAKPNVNTLSASSITYYSANLNGQANPNNAATTGWFRYSSNNTTSCDDSFGTRVPSTGGVNLGSGSSFVNYSQNVGSLSQSTMYYYCAIAENSVGKSFGNVLTFTTLANNPPSVSITHSPSNPLVGETITFSATASDSDGVVTEIKIFVDSVNTKTCSGSGITNCSYSNTSSVGNHSYYARATDNAGATTTSSTGTFSVKSSPMVTTLAASNVQRHSATLNGRVNPNSAETTAWFRYSTTAPSNNTCDNTFGTSTSATSVGGGTSNVDYSSGISGLNQNTTYYYCAIANNSVGISFGEVVSFTTVSNAAPNTDITHSPQNPNNQENVTFNATSSDSDGNITETRIYVDGSLVKTCASSTCSYNNGPYSVGNHTYQSGTTDNDGATASSSIKTFTVSYVNVAPSVSVSHSPASPSSGQNVTVSSLASDSDGNIAEIRVYVDGSHVKTCNNQTTCNYTSSSYAIGSHNYYATAVDNSGASTNSSTGTFVVSGTPSVTTLNATNVTSNSAILNGRVNPNFAETTAWFRYSSTNPGSCTDSFGTAANSTNVGSGGSAVDYSQRISGLGGNTTYYYCAIASNSVGIGYGQVLSFTL